MGEVTSGLLAQARGDLLVQVEEFLARDLVADNNRVFERRGKNDSGDRCPPALGTEWHSIKRVKEWRTFPS